MTTAAEAARGPLPRETARCDHCGARESTPVTSRLPDAEASHLPEAFREERFQLVRCERCDLVYLRERPAARDLDVYYGDAYMCFESYEERGAIMRLLAARVARGKLKQIRQLMPPDADTLLDYGCGSGTWLAQIRDQGGSMRMIGVDITEGPLEQVRARGMEAHCCDENTLFEHVEPASVGVIHLFHVIEHLPSPSRVLARLHEALVPGGIILGQTPNVASLGRRFWGDLWNQWHVPRHFVLYSHETLHREAERAGFEVVSIRSSLSGATQWAHSALRWIALRRGREWRSIHEPLYAPAILAFLPLTVAECLLAHSCHMDFVLRRR
jgi:2-polyprenyl-3-methyl-5-hydroxy-6-metoxy-1,4-benzoquinol methylase